MLGLLVLLSPISARPLSLKWLYSFKWLGEKKNPNKITIFYDI